MTVKEVIQDYKDAVKRKDHPSAALALVEYERLIKNAKAKKEDNASKEDRQ
jgi:hypothetical protein